MGENLRKSGIKYIGDLPWGSHFCQFYQTMRDLKDILVPYFKAGLENNESCIWVVSQALDLEEVNEVLRKSVPDVDIYLERGQIELIPCTDWRIERGTFDPDKALNLLAKKLKGSLTNGYEGIRLIENISWQGKKNWKCLIDYEEKLDNFIENNQIIYLCAYSLNRLNTAEIIDVTEKHQFTLSKQEGEWEKIENIRLRRAEEAAVQVAKDIDIKLKEERKNLEKLVEERTLQLEKAYNLLKESEQDLAEAQQMAHVGNWKWNILTGEIYWSKEVCRIFQRSPHELSTTYDAFLNYVHPEDRNYVLNAIKEGFNGNPSVIDYRIVLPDGKEKIVNTQAEITFNEENVPIRAKGIVQDVTERRRAEEAIRLSNNYNRSLIEASLDPLVTIRPDGKITDVNVATELVTGYSRKELIGTDFSDYFTEPEKASKGYQQVFIKGEVRDYPLEIRHKDGHLTPVLYNASVYKDEAAKVIGIFATARDITELKKAEEILKQKSGEIARKKEIHHRIKNNLQVISSLLDLQAEKFGSREFVEISEVLEAFRESQDRVASIALIHEELHEGEETDALNFSQYLERLVENLFQTYRFGNINISLNLDLEENVFFDMDIAVPLGIIVNELVSNSLKHAFPNRDDGNILIKLLRKESSVEKTKKNYTGRERDVKNDKFILLVSDNGIGIPETIDLENSDTLGLQLVSTLIDQLNGRFELRRENGTEFIIEISMGKDNKNLCK